MELYNVIVSFFQDGGPFMYPILLVLAIGIAIALERWVYLERMLSSNQRDWKHLAPMVTDGRYDKALIATVKTDSAIGNILNSGLERHRSTTHREDIETAMEERLMEAMPQFERRTHYLATFANIATLLGLLGTIIGLIRAFTAIANVDPAQKADMLSASISVAMNTTAFGLMVAIPLLLLHTFLQTRTTELIDSLEMAAVRFLNMVSETRTRA